MPPLKQSICHLQRRGNSSPARRKTPNVCKYPDTSPLCSFLIKSLRSPFGSPLFGGRGVYDLAICSCGCLISTDQFPFSHDSSYGSETSFRGRLTRVCGRSVRIMLVGETSSLLTIVKGVNRGGSKIFVPDLESGLDMK